MNVVVKYDVTLLRSMATASLIFAPIVLTFICQICHFISNTEHKLIIGSVSESTNSVPECREIPSLRVHGVSVLTQTKGRVNRDGSRISKRGSHPQGGIPTY